MRVILLIAMGLILASCNNSTSASWKETSSTSYEGRFERAKAICNGRAGETQVAAGRLWIAGAIGASSTFNACMAEQGFTRTDKTLSLD